MDRMAETEKLQSTRSSRLHAFLSWVVVLVLGLVWIFGTANLHHREVRPPPSVTDFESYLRDMRAPRSLMILQDKNGVILVATGDISQLASLAIPSGPPQYVFGADGKLVDWIGDSGEGKSWRPGTSTPLVKSLTVPEARVWLAEQKSAAPAKPN